MLSMHERRKSAISASVNAYEILATARLEERANDARKEAKYRGCAFSTCTQARTTRKSLLEPTCSHLDDRSRFRVYMVRLIFLPEKHRKALCLIGSLFW